MTTLETALIVIVILLVFTLGWKKSASAPAAETISTSRSLSGVQAHAPDCKCSRCFNPEKHATMERMEYYGNRAPGSETCDPNSDLSYAKFDYGSSNADFKDYIAGEAVTSQVKKNHDEYVKDRIGDFQTQNVTGRTFAVDNSIEGDPIKWVGIRGRPQLAPIYNPTQLPDVDEQRYVPRQKLVWDTNTHQY